MGENEEKKGLSENERMLGIGIVWILAIFFAFVPVPFFQDIHPLLGGALAIGLSIAIWYYNSIFGAKPKEEAK
jgi:hypothetical protein